MGREPDSNGATLICHDANGQVVSGTISDVDRPGYDPLVGADIRGRAFQVRFKQTF